MPCIIYVFCLTLAQNLLDQNTRLILCPLLRRLKIRPDLAFLIILPFSLKATMNITVKSTAQYSTILLLVLVLFQCANPIAPTGGPRDETPPKIDSLESTPNKQTNFSQRSFELTFDEWIKLEDVFTQVVVSPPLDFEVALKRKTVLFEIKEGDTLRANTTYTINFGEAIQDLNESNPAKNLRFVFSTGPFLDSLSMSGQLVDVTTRKPVEEAYFMLYENTADSVVRTLRPYYFGQSDENGFFSIENLKPGNYKGFALKSTGANKYLYTNQGSELGIVDSLIPIQAGSSPNLQIMMFVEDKPLRINGKDAREYGLVKIIFNQPDPRDVSIDLPDGLVSNWASEVINDTIKVWYQNPADTAWQFYVRKDSTLNDTIEIRTPNRSNYLRNARFFRKGRVPRGNLNLSPGDQVQIEWNRPIERIDTNYIQVSKGNEIIPLKTIAIDSNQLRMVTLDFAYQQDSVYNVLALPGAFVDWTGVINDSINLDYKIGNLEDYGNIILKIDGLDSTQSYLCELLQGTSLVDTFYIDQQPAFEYRKNTLRSGQYSIRIIEDRNQNRYWDTGNYDRKEQPELIFTKKLDQLRANWDLEVTVNLPDLFGIEVKETSSNNRR